VGGTTPSGQKINARVGQKVILNVTTDPDDGGPGATSGQYRLASRPEGSFVLDSAGNTRSGAHHLEKIIVILNAR
jgi:hypothetical protein